MQWLEGRWRNDASEEKAHTCSMDPLDSCMSAAKLRDLSGTNQRSGGADMIRIMNID